MIYDCFTLFNELDLLEARLNILKNVVDFHVIVEDSWTFARRLKPLHYLEQQARFAEFAHKIIYTTPTQRPTFDRWQNEYNQRNAIVFGLQDAQPDDLILISDVDEIPHPDSFALAQPICAWDMVTYYYDLNHRSTVHHLGPVACFYKDLTTPQEIRNQRLNPEIRVIAGKCWHFSCFGGDEAISTKLANFAHEEYSSAYWTDVDRIRQRREQNLDVVERAEFPTVYEPLNAGMPLWMLENLHRFPHWGKL